MTKRRILIFIFLLSAFGISFFILTFDLFEEKIPPRVYQVSMIVRGTSSDQWAAIRQGALQAASEQNVELTFITLNSPNNVTEQSALLTRETAGGADAVILACADSEQLTKEVSALAEKTPIITIESKLDVPAVVCHISADNYEMGHQLAQEIYKRVQTRRLVAIADGGIHCEAVQQRYAGLTDGLQELGIPYAVWSIPNDVELAAQMLHTQISTKEAGVVVALDLSTLDITARVVTELQSNYLELFGIGSSPQIASYLEQDIITATSVQNDFAIGYLSVQAAATTLDKRNAPAKNTVVEYRLIYGETMYDTENQRLLFPEIR